MITTKPEKEERSVVNLTEEMALQVKKAARFLYIALVVLLNLSIVRGQQSMVE